MAPRQRVCHSVANARLISRLMSPREEKDVPLLPASSSITNRGHSVFSKDKNTAAADGRSSKKRERWVIRMQHEWR